MKLIPSDYMRWAKQVTRHPLRYELTQSGMASLPWESLPLTAASLTRPYPYDAPELKEVLAGLHDVTPEQVVIAPGTSGANFLVAAALLEPGDRILMEAPTYEPLRCTLASFQTEIVPLPRPASLGFQPDLENLDALISGVKLVVLTNLHNPTGVTLDPARLRTLLDAAARHGAWVLVDEVYLDFVEEPPYAPIEDHVITTASLTKVYGLSGLRMGWVVGAKAAIERIHDAKNLIQVIDPFPMQDLATQVLRDRDRIRHAHRRIADANRPRIGELARRLDLPWVAPTAGIIGVLGLPAGVSAPALVTTMMERYETRAVPGDFFGLPGHLRIGYGHSAPEILEEGLARLGRAIEDARG